MPWQKLGPGVRTEVHYHNVGTTLEVLLRIVSMKFSRDIVKQHQGEGGAFLWFAFLVFWLFLGFMGVFRVRDPIRQVESIVFNLGYVSIV